MNSPSYSLKVLHFGIMFKVTSDPNPALKGLPKTCYSSLFGIQSALLSLSARLGSKTLQAAGSKILPPSSAVYLAAFTIANLLKSMYSCLKTKFPSSFTS